MPMLIIDIGDSVTTVRHGAGGAPEEPISLGVGARTLSTQNISNDPPKPEELLSCLEIVGFWLDDLDRAIGPTLHDGTNLARAEEAAPRGDPPSAEFDKTEESPYQDVVMLGATPLAAAAIELGVDLADATEVHGFVLSRSAAEEIFRTLATEDHQARAANPGLPAGEVETIVAGMAILIKVMRHFDLGTVLVAAHDSPLPATTSLADRRRQNLGSDPNEPYRGDDLAISRTASS